LSEGTSEADRGAEATRAEQGAWEAAFEKALRKGDILGASDVLRKAGREGWVKRATHEHAARIVDRVGPAPLVRREWSSTLLAHPRRVDKELAATLLTPIARSHTREVQRAFERLAQDTDAGARAAASRLGATLLTDAYAELRSVEADADVLRLMRALADDHSPIARQVARSMAGAVVAKRPELASALGVRADVAP
jgi:hypothetical protein